MFFRRLSSRSLFKCHFRFNSTKESSSKKMSPEEFHKDIRLHSLLLQNGLIDVYPVLESRDMDLPTFLKSTESELKSYGVDPKRIPAVMGIIVKTKELQHKELLYGEALRESKLDEVARSIWNWNKKPSEHLPPLEYKPKHPLVLCHGIGGSKPGLPYFYSIVEDMEDAGCRAFRWPVERYSNIETRAKSLQKRIEWYITNSPDITKVNLIAHSMGGLDSRYYISSLGGHRYVSSLTTIATPHRGSPWASLLLSYVDLQSWFPIVPEGYRNLTEEYLKGFNPNNPDHPDVDYYSVVCSKEMTPLDIFYVPYSYIKAVEGPNDGLVSVKSQEWGKVIERVELNHNQQHLSDEGRALFRRIANYLGKNGH